MKKTLVKGLAGATLIAVALVGASTGGAVAAKMITGKQIKNGTITSADLAKNSVTRSELAPGSVNFNDELDEGTRALIRSLAGKDGAPGAKGDPGNDGADGTNGTNGNDGADGADGAVGPAGPQGPAGPPGAPGADGADGADGVTGFYLGGSHGDIAAADKVITNVGGGYAGATDMFTITVAEAGKYLINADGFFDRLNSDEGGYIAPTTDTYMQLSVRGTGNTVDYGTCFTGAVPQAGFINATCSTSRVVDIPANTTLTVRGFGYNADRSASNGGQMKAKASVSLVKVG